MAYLLDKTGDQVKDQLTTVVGGIHVHENSTAQSIPTGTTYTKIINFGDNNSASSNITPDSANNKITITKAGKYRIEGNFNIISDPGNIEVWISLYKNGVEIDSCHIKRKISVANDVGSASFTDTILCNASDELDVRVRHDDPGSVDITFEYMNFNASRVGI